MALYRQPIDISEQSGSTLSSYEVKLTFGTGDTVFSQAQSNGSDIRFYDSDDSTLIDHWIENYDATSETATIWVEVPQLNASSTETIYMYFGDGNTVRASNGDATFNFFDDFTGTLGDWLSTCGNWSINGSNNLYQSDTTVGRSCILANYSASSYVLETVMAGEDSSGGGEGGEQGLYRHVSAYNSSHDRYESFIRGRAADDAPTWYRAGNSGCTTGSATNINSPLLSFAVTSQFYRYKYVVNGGAEDLYIDGNLESSLNDTSRTSGYIGFGGYQGTIEIQFVFVRTWASTEPTTTKQTASEVIPSAPSNLSVTAYSDTTISLSWSDNSNNENGFYVYRAQSSGSSTADYTRVADLASNTTSYQDTNLSRATTYYYRVSAYNAEGESSLSNEVNQTTNELLSGTVTSGNTAISGANIYIIDTTNGDLEATATTDVNGDYSAEVSTGLVVDVVCQYDDGTNKYHTKANIYQST